MACEHYGVLEVFRYESWMGIVRTESLLLDEHELLGSLFGGDDSAGFPPLFSARGLPADVSEDFRRLTDELQVGGATVILASSAMLGDLRAIPWEDLAKEYDARIHKIRVTDDGAEQLVGKALSYPEVDAPVGWPGIEVRVNEFVYRRVRLRRRDLLVDSAFPVLMELAEVLASHYGEENVRWSVVLVT